MSCGQISLKESNIQVEKYYSSENDKFCIQQTQCNFPETIQLGDINDWKKWNINWKEIDLILAGSPCQGFSFAGKGLNFDDPRSKLFFVFVDILDYCKLQNSNVKFLFENVNMKKIWISIINKYLKLLPIRINSSLVSAQKRDRLYWTNIKTKKEGIFFIKSNIPQPKNRNIHLKDILENGYCDRVKSYCIDANYYKGTNLNLYKNNRRQIVYLDKCSTIKTDGFLVNTKRKRKNGKAIETPLSQKRIRKLTINECLKLQTIPDWYKWIVSDTQIYKMLGNGWTIEVIKHIFSYL